MKTPDAPDGKKPHDKPAKKGPVARLDVKTHLRSRTVEFDTSRSTSDTGIVKQRLDFGDGSPPVTWTADTISFEFDKPGKYNAVLTASGVAGAKCGGTTKTLSVSDEGYRKMSIEVDTAKTKRAKTVLSRVVDFGDGSPPVTMTKDTLFYEYPETGIYTVAVHITTQDDETATLSMTIYSSAIPATDVHEYP